MFNLGLVSVSFRDHSVEEIINAMNQCEIHNIEWGGDIHAPINEIENAEKIRFLQQKFNIRCTSYGSYYRIGISDPFDLPKYYATAYALQADCVRVWCGDKNYEDYSKSEKRILFSEAQKACEIARMNRRAICLECHNNTYTNSIDGALEIMNEIDDEFFRMYWQPNQFKSFEENCEYAKRISNFTTNIHVFNWKGQEKYPLSKAIDEWTEYLKYFNDDKEHNLLLEFMPDGRIESLKEEYNALQEIVERVR